MKTLIISSSLNPDSKSFIMCKEIAEKMGTDAELVDAREMELAPYHIGPTDHMNELKEKILKADNIIFGMAVYCYSINDSLKIILDSCMEYAVGKFFGILCTAGGNKSYLATQHLSQICMNEWRMIQLPRIVYATESNFENGKITDDNLRQRINEFVKEFTEIGRKLLG